mmetsp:Transcript_7068/g.7935  ORF Transcript_7068/g.7935 Transcript_7068/m.7935 type:complete len:493 (-) Transcript_7068:34-1512(-)
MLKFLIALLALAIFTQQANADFLSTGLGLLSGGDSAGGGGDLMTSQALPYLFKMLTKSTFEEFPFKGGKLTNIDIQVIPPKSFEEVKMDVLSETMSFEIGGLGAKIGADFEVIIKGRPANGHLDIDITDLGVNLKLKNEPKEENGRKIATDIKLDLEHTHADVRISAEGDTEEIKNYLIGLVTKEIQENIIPESFIPKDLIPEGAAEDWTKKLKFWTGTKSVGPMHYAMIKKTQSILNQFIEEQSALQNSPIITEDMSYKVGGGKVLADYGSIVLSKMPETEGIKDKLIRKGQNGLFSQGSFNKMDLQNGLKHDAQHIDHHANKPRLDYSFSAENYAQFFVKADSDQPILDKDMIKKLLDKDSGINKKVENYFGGKVQFKCEPTSTEPSLRKGDGASIIGTYTVNCFLNTENNDKEPAYQMDLDLEFTIHPDNKEDGNPLDRFGEFSTASMGMSPDGAFKTTIGVSDEPEPMMMFPGFADLFGELFSEFDFE